MAMLTYKQRRNWLKLELPIIGVIVFVVLAVMVLCLLFVPTLHRSQDGRNSTKCNDSLLNVNKVVNFEPFHPLSERNQTHSEWKAVAGEKLMAAANKLMKKKKTRRKNT